MDEQTIIKILLIFMTTTACLGFLAGFLAGLIINKI